MAIFEQILTHRKMEETLIKKNSKVVTLMRQYSFVEESNKDPEVKEYFDMAFKALGSYAKTAGGPAASGLSRSEERALMPEITGIYPEDGRKEFQESVNKYFKNLNTKVEPKGVKLEIGLENPKGEVGFINGKDDKEGINFPVNVTQYIKYRHAIGHPLCALNQDDAEKYQHIKFFIKDDGEIIKATTALNKLEDIARKEYFRIIEDQTKVVQVLSMLGTPNAKKLDPNTAEIALKGFSTIDPSDSELNNETKLKKFKTIATDKELAVKYDILQFISAGIFDRVGSRILIKESGDQIGVNLKEAAKWMLDKSNVQLIGAFRAQLEEFGGGKMTSI